MRDFILSNPGSVKLGDFYTRSAFVITLAFIMSMVVLAGCANENEEKTNAQKDPPMISQGAHGEMPSAGGVSWTIPDRWQVGDERPMRVATYVVPAADGDESGAECAVFHFGEGQGGDIESNIARWVGQFENPSEPRQSTIETNGLNITTVATTGTFLETGKIFSPWGHRWGTRRVCLFQNDRSGKYGPQSCR